MGIRHIMISNICVPGKDELPDWFVEKWSEDVSLKDYADFWLTKTEHKAHGKFSEFPEDVLKALKEIDWSAAVDVELLFFNDAKTSNEPYFSLYINKGGIEKVVL